MVVPAFLFVFLPLTLVGILCCLRAAWCEARGSDGAEGARAIALRLTYALAIAGALVALLERLSYPDWKHLYWAAQFPLMGAFYLSGATLARLWPADGQPAARARGWRGAAAFLALCIGFALLPLVLQLAIPDPDPPPRATGAPVARLIELAHWGLGGPLPASLRPEATDVGRSIAHLPRELTVPLGIALTAAWAWIAFCVLALGSRAIRAPRARRAWLLALPALAAALFFHELVHASNDAALGWNLLWPLGAEHDALWRSVPAVLASFGPVLVVAALLGAALFAALAAANARRAPD